MQTDDPETPGPNRWEINLAWTTKYDSGDRAHEAPLLDINYGVGERLQLKYEIPWLALRPEHGQSQQGLGGSLLGIKWRFYDSGAEGWQISTYPQYQFSTVGSASRLDTTDEGSSWLLPLEVQGKCGDYNVICEIGRRVRSDDEDEWIAGIAAGREASARVEAIAEVYATFAQAFDRNSAILNGGLRFKVSPVFHCSRLRRRRNRWQRPPVLDRISRHSVCVRTNMSRLIIALVCVAWGTLTARGAGPDDRAFSHTIYLVRHGAYDQQAKVDPEVGGPLNPLGIAEARLVGARLRGLLVHIDSITSSTMERARETAAIVRESLPDVESRQSSDLSECTPPATHPLAGESPDEQAACAKRLDHVFAERFAPSAITDRNDLIVAHGNVIRYLVTKALGVDTHAWTVLSLAHGSLTVIRVRADGTMSVLSVGDVGHIPPNLQSWGIAEDPQLVAPIISPSRQTP